MRRSSRLMGLIFAAMGTMLLLNSRGNPRIEALHGADVLRLIACGGLFGIGLLGLAGQMRD